MTSRRGSRGSGEVKRVAGLLGRFSGGRRLYVLALVMLIFEAVTAIFTPYPLAYLIDLLQGQRPPLDINLPLLSSPRTETVAVLTIALVVITMVNSLGDSMAEIYLARGGRIFGYNLRAALHAHLQRLSLSFHDQRQAGDMLTRVTSDVTAVEDFVVKSVSDLTGGFLVLIGTLAFLFYKSWAVAVIAILIVPILATISNHYSRHIKAASKRQRASEGELASAAQEMLTSIRVIQTYGRANYETERFTAQSRSAMEAALETAGLQARFSWVVAVLEAVAVGTVVWAGLWLIDRDAITVGTLVLFTVLIENMFKPTRKIIREWSVIGKIFASVERIAEVLDREVTVFDAPDAVSAPPFRGDVAFDHVHFSYKRDESAHEIDRSHRVALRDVNFAVEAGKVVALVGPSGAGKSTIAQLIPRLYDPDQGAVRIDDVDIRRCTLDSLRAQISVVLQDTVLFSGTVADNIRYGRDDATEEAIVEAARRANADAFIRELPEGYATRLGERAANLSGGQRQRIAIARAFVRDAPILILDEPTTGLDASAAELVLDGLRSLMQGKTTLIITHNLNLIRTAHQILVIEGGRIVEEGDHRSLIARGGAYARYCEKQGGLTTATEDVAVEAGQTLAPLGARLRERARQAWSGRSQFFEIPPGAKQLDTGAPGDRNGSPAATAPPPAVEEASVVKEPAPDLAAIDALNSPRLHTVLPGLRRALDSHDMARDLQDHLLAPGVAIRRCRPVKALYLGREGCAIRYEIEAADGNESRRLFVLGRVLPDDQAVAAYQAALAPLVDKYNGRMAAAGLARSAVTLPDRVVLHAFPVDPELPTLIAATDPERMRSELARNGDGVAACRIEVAPSERRGLCVLRYDVRGTHDQRWTTYGSVIADGRADHMVSALRALAGGLPGVAVPRLWATVPELKLALLDAPPGEASLARELSAPGGSPGRIVEEAALTAAAVHASQTPVGPDRSLDDELKELRHLVRIVEEMSPQLGDILESSLRRVVEAGSSTDALPLGFSHGDFTPSHILSGPDGPALIDFDSVCRAETALDLGRYVASLRLAVVKARPDEYDLADDLADLFLTAYVEASTLDVPEDQLRARTRVYECLGLLGSTVHAWRGLKRARTRMMLPVLAREVGRVPEP